MANFQTEFTFTHSAFHLSTDYDLLWDLIRAGHRIPGWLVCKDWGTILPDLVWDLVEIKMRKTDLKYMIGTRGVGYESFSGTVDDFRKNCAQYSLHFVLPHVGGQSVTILHA